MNFYDKLLTQTKESYYLVIVLGIIASSCIGSVAASLALKSLPGVFEMIQLCISVGTAMWFNATVLAQLSHKALLNALIISLVANSLIIVIHLV